MPDVITGLAPTTELEAINAMLSTIGESPLSVGTDLSASLPPDASLAVSLLRNAAREALCMGWRFNSEDGVELAPVGTLAWVDTAGVTTELNVFRLPTGVLSWHQTDCLSNRDLDLVQRVSKVYQEAGANVPVLYDRNKNRDGAEGANHPFVYVDVFWAVDFVNLPESARRYIAVRASRQFAQQALGSQQLSMFAERDELFALRTLKREQGLTRKLNILDNGSVRAVLGGRPAPRYGAWQQVYPGHA